MKLFLVLIIATILIGCGSDDKKILKDSDVLIIDEDTEELLLDEDVVEDTEELLLDDDVE